MHERGYYEWVEAGVVDVWPLKVQVKLSGEAEWKRFVDYMVNARDTGKLAELTPLKLVEDGFIVLPKLAYPPEWTNQRSGRRE